jgi:probable O-glycosylation ligase (exosortase A-associated)
MGRVNAWWMAYNLARDRFLGSGFENVTTELFQKYAPYQDVKPQGPHSIYFQVLGQHGFFGLFLFLLMWILVWRMASRVVRQSRRIPEARWCGDLAAMCQVSLVGYLVGGAFLALAYFDLPSNIMVLVVLSHRWIANEEWRREATQQADIIEDAAAPQPRTPLEQRHESPL